MAARSGRSRIRSTLIVTLVISAAAVALTPLGAGATTGIVVTKPCTLSATAVAPGASLRATGVITNQGSTSITLRNVVLAARPPGGTNKGGPYEDFMPTTGSITLGAGESRTLNAAKTFSTTAATGAWYCYLTYRTSDRVWHDDSRNVSFHVGTTNNGIAVTKPCTLSATSVGRGASLTATGAITNQGSSSVTLRKVVLAARPPGGTNKGGPYEDFMPTIGRITLGAGESRTLNAAKTFSTTAATGAWYCYLTYRTSDRVWHDDTRNANFQVTSGATPATGPNPPVVSRPTTSPPALPPAPPTPVPVPPTGPVRGGAPGHVLALQGPTDPGALYVMVTWDRNDPTATGFDVFRNGVQVASTTVAGDPWDDFDYTDTAVSAGRAYSYQVRARYPDGTASALSAASRVTIRSTSGVGSGRVFDVDSYSGSDVERARSAVSAAKSAGGGVVLFGPRTYVFSGALDVGSANNVVLRGAGLDRTFIQPGFAGAGSAGGGAPSMIRFGGSHVGAANRLTAPINVGDRTASFDSVGGLAPGQVLIFDQKYSQAEPTRFDQNNIVQDPGTGRDDRYRWDANEIVSVSGSTVTFKYPFSQSFTTAVRPRRASSGFGNGIERLTVQGRSAGDTTYYRLVSLRSQSRFVVGDVRGRWANQNYFSVGGTYDVRFVRFHGPHGGAVNYTRGITKYKLAIGRAANFTFIGGVMGEPTHDQNKSFITTQWAQRSLVRNSQFFGSRNYSFNEHGGGSRHYIFENNYIKGTPNTYYGVAYLGNSTWGFAGAGILRNNVADGGPRFLHLEENSYEVRVLDNVVRNLVPSPTSQGTTSARFIYGEGWRGPDTHPHFYGSLRLTVARNRVTNVSGDGVDLGRAGSNFFPYLGVRDVVIKDNSFSVSGAAIRLQGDSSATRRFQVSGNSGTNRYVKPALGSTDHWAGNADGVTQGIAKTVPWTSESFDWSRYDTSR